MEGGSRSPCPLDMDFSTQIAALLSPPSAESVKDYYAELIAIRKCPGLKINFNNDSGKAVFSVKEFEEGELVLKDPVLVAAQHTTNKVDCLVCSHCFRFIGSVELQIGRKLILQDLGLTDDNEKDCTMASHNVGTDSLFDRKDDTSTSTYQNLKKNYISGEVLESLVGGKLSLPFSSIFSLPSVFDCPGGCKEEHYCSKSCADSDWEFVHSILCTGRNKESSQRDAMLKFIEHANIGRRSPGPHDTLEPVTGLGHPIQTHRRLKRRVQTRCGGEMTAVAVPSAVVAEGDELPPKAPPLHEAVWLMITSCLGGA